MKLIYGGLAKQIAVKGIQIAICQEEMLPDNVEVMVFEEDTNLILTVDKELYYEEVHPIRLMTDIMKTRAIKPGSLVTNGKSWYAVVIDINAETICDPKWVSEAYTKVFERLEQRKIFSVGMHLLGTRHGKIAIETSLDLFLNCIEKETQKYLKNIWFVVAESAHKTIQKSVYSQIQRTLK